MNYHLPTKAMVAMRPKPKLNITANLSNFLTTHPEPLPPRDNRDLSSFLLASNFFFWFGFNFNAHQYLQ